MKAKTKLKTRRMWCDAELFATPTEVVVCGNEKELADDLCVAVIPLDDVDALLAAANSAYGTEPTMSSTNGMVAALTAIGVLPRTRKGRK